MLGQYYTADAYCVTLVPGAASALVLEGFGVDFTVEPAGDEPSVCVIEGAGFVVAVEPNGWQGTRSEVLRRVAPGGRAASLFCNVNMNTRLTLSAAGSVLFSEEAAGQPTVDAAVASYFDGLDFEAEALEGHPYESVGWWTSGITVMERFTGVILDGPPPAGHLRAFRVVPWLEDLPTSAGPVRPTTDRDIYSFPDWPLGEAAFGEDGLRRLVRQVGQVDDAARRRLTLWAAREGLRRAELLDDPRLSATLASFDKPTGPVMAEATERLMRDTFNVPSGEQAPKEYNALKALERALRADWTGGAVGAMCRVGYQVLCDEHETGHPGGAVMAAPLSTKMGYLSAHDFLDDALTVLGC